jgi:4-amino-4-deoxy-L-arabinose transferase-like glycosyltransferase
MRLDPASPALGRQLWVLYALGAAAFLPAIAFHHVGEEAIFTLASLEMWFHGEWARQILFGQNLQHNPLFNWIIIGACQVVGWEHMLAVARTVTIGATVSSGLVLAWLARRVFADPVFAAFSAVVYLMLADPVLYRGWLSYVDPLFGFLVFSAVACLWVACHERRLSLLGIGVAALTAAFLAKALTAYVFYGTAALILAWNREFRRFLLSPGSIAIHAAGALAIAIWLGAVPATQGQGTRMFKEILDKVIPEGMGGYFAKLVLYPLETVVKLAPATLLAGYYLYKRRAEAAAISGAARIAAIIVVASYLPYWLAPQSHTRYLVPIYPMAALVLAYLIWNARPGSIAVTARWFYGLLALKLVLFIGLFPYYQSVYRGENYKQAAHTILERTAGHPLYTLNVSASGLNVKAYIDIKRLPHQPLAFPPGQWDSGFVIAYDPDPKVGKVAERYRLAGNDLYLLCRGAACESGGTSGLNSAAPASRSPRSLSRVPGAAGNR